MALTIRNGQKVWPWCPTCGCRLQIFYNDGERAAVSHFYPNRFRRLDTDARGCKCPEIEKTWGILSKNLIGV